MNFALELRNMPFANPPPPPPPQSMLITLSGTMVISCLPNIVQGGGDVLPGVGTFKHSQNVPTVLQPIVVTHSLRD